MTYNPDKHHRKSIRLKEFDYTQAGWYYFTIVVQDRECLLGEIENGKIILNNCGEIIEAAWLKIPELRPYVELDDFIIMPNHFHGILIINENSNDSKVRVTDSVTPTKEIEPVAPTKDALTNIARLIPNSLGAILGQFKSFTTKEIRKAGIVYFKWQRNYWERIIRDENELNSIRRYILNNPLKWEEDKYKQE